MTRPSHLVLAVLAVMPIAETARAQIAGAPAEQQNPTPGNRNPAPTGEPMSGAGLFSDQRTNLLGDLFGLRASAGNDGISFGLTETSEVFGNATGGIRRGADYDGLTTIGIGLDTQKALGWQGGVFNVSALQIHGRDLSADDLFSLNTNSGIEADRTFRLWEAWYQQSFIGGMADIKIGQQSLDQEFINSIYAGTFINTMMGWPVVPSYDLYAGGPAYPLASLGIRLRVRATPALTILAGVFDDNPSGGPFDNDPQLRRAERSGTEFNLGTGALVFAEAQYAIDQPSPSPSGSGSGLPGTYRFGGWFDSASFLDQDLDGDDVSLASSLSTGSAHARRRNFSLYAVADQMIWRPDP
jgi:porin